MKGAYCNRLFDSRYKFTAKACPPRWKLDNETQYTYFGARYYDSDISIWLSVDPLAQERPWLSPYNYCQLNPIGRIDPTGALDGEILDGFTIDRSGNIQRVDNTGGNEYHVLYNKADYDAGKRDYDESGTKSGIKIDRDELSNFHKLKISNVDDETGEPTGKVDYNRSFNIHSNSVAESLHLFLDKNTDVEWSNVLMTNSYGEQLNLMSTSLSKETIKGAWSLVHNYIMNGWSIIEDTHNHPENKNGQNASLEDGDMGYRQNVQRYCKLPHFSVHSKLEFQRYSFSDKIASGVL